MALIKMMAMPSFILHQEPMIQKPCPLTPKAMVQNVSSKVPRPSDQFVFCEAKPNGKEHPFQAIGTMVCTSSKKRERARTRRVVPICGSNWSVFVIRSLLRRRSPRKFSAIRRRKCRKDINPESTDPM